MQTFPGDYVPMMGEQDSASLSPASLLSLTTDNGVGEIWYGFDASTMLTVSGDRITPLGVEFIITVAVTASAGGPL